MNHGHTGQQREKLEALRAAAEDIAAVFGEDAPWGRAGSEIVEQVNVELGRPPSRPVPPLRRIQPDSPATVS